MPENTTNTPTAPSGQNAREFYLMTDTGAYLRYADDGSWSLQEHRGHGSKWTAPDRNATADDFSRRLAIDLFPVPVSAMETAERLAMKSRLSALTPAKDPGCPVTFSTILGKPIAQYLAEQFPATIGHRPLSLMAGYGAELLELRDERTRHADRISDLEEDVKHYKGIMEAFDNRFGCGHAKNGAEDCWQHVKHLDELTTERDNLAAICDPPIARLQFPDGSVPGNGRECAEGWHRIAGERDAQIRAMADEYAAESGRMERKHQDTIANLREVEKERDALLAERTEEREQRERMIAAHADEVAELERRIEELQAAPALAGIMPRTVDKPGPQPKSRGEAVEIVRESLRLSELDLRTAVQTSAGDEVEARLLYRLLYDLIEPLVKVVRVVEDVSHAMKGDK